MWETYTTTTLISNNRCHGNVRTIHVIRNHMSNNRRCTHISSSLPFCWRRKPLGTKNYWAWTSFAQPFLALVSRLVLDCLFAVLKYFLTLIAITKGASLSLCRRWPGIPRTFTYVFVPYRDQGQLKHGRWNEVRTKIRRTGSLNWLWATVEVWVELVHRSSCFTALKEQEIRFLRSTKALVVVKVKGNLL